MQQRTKIEIGERSGVLQEVHPRLRAATGLNQHVLATPEKQKKSHDSTSCPSSKKKEPVVHPGSMSDSEIKEHTGFASLQLMMFFIVIVCNGDLETMSATVSSLTWFEEWFFYFEWTWGRSLLRWCDADRIFGLDNTVLRNIFDKKLAMVRKAVHLWPRFASHDEDMQLRRQHWKERYKNARVIMWDNTNLNFMAKPEDAELQRLTFLLYYGANVAKGAIFLQLCGWLGGWELWLGAVSDSDYFQRCGLLEFQKEFQCLDASSTLSFTNILDKGYRCIRAAWRAGGQLLLQPFFAKSDRKFTGREVLMSGAVATDRSSNERAVKVMKSSLRLVRGIHQRQNLDTYSDLWIGWGFQCNFMFSPVL